MNNFPIVLIIIFFIYYILDYQYNLCEMTAIEIVNDMGIGYNLGNTTIFNCCSGIEDLEIKNGIFDKWGMIFPTKKIINKIKKIGFKTIRFQAIYINIIDDNGNLDYDWLSKIKELINWIINLNMYCILSIRHDGEFWRIGGKNAKEIYVNLWKQIANGLKDYDEHLVFESNNEVNYDEIYDFDDDYNDDYDGEYYDDEYYDD